MRASAQARQALQLVPWALSKYSKCFYFCKDNYMTNELKDMRFTQIVKKPTHIDGGLIDHIYVRQGNETKFSWVLEQFPKYYSDHDGLSLTFGKVSK